jgi:hypothetical protein
LKPTQPVPPGKKIKCPKCGHIFVTTAAGPSTSAGSQPKPRIPVAALVDDEPEEGGWELVEEEEPAPAPKKSAKAKRIAERDDEEAEDNAEVDERPRRRPKAAQRIRRGPEDEEDEDDEWDEDDEDEDYSRRRSGRKKSSAGKLLKIYLGLVALTLLLLAGGTAVGLYWYVNRERNRGTGNEDPLAFVLPDSVYVMGMNMPALMQEPTLARAVEGPLKAGVMADFFKNVKNETGLEMAELCERTFLTISPGPPTGPTTRSYYTTTVWHSKSPFSQRKIRNCLSEPIAERIKGKTVYRTKSETFFMPSDRIIVVTNLPDDQLGTIVGSDGTSPALGAEAQNLLRSVENHHVWMVVPFSGTNRSQIEKLTEGAPPNFLPLLKLLIKAQGAAGGYTLSGGQVMIEAELAFADSASAKELTGEIEGFWNREVKGLTTQIALSALPMKSLTDLLKEVIKTTKFSSEGSKTKATAQFSVQHLTDVMKESQNQQFKIGPMAGPAPGPGGRTVPAPGPAVPRGPVQLKKKR